MKRKTGKCFFAFAAALAIAGGILAAYGEEVCAAVREPVSELTEEADPELPENATEETAVEENVAEENRHYRLNTLADHDGYIGMGQLDICFHREKDEPTSFDQDTLDENSAEGYEWRSFLVSVNYDAHYVWEIGGDNTSNWMEIDSEIHDMVNRFYVDHNDKIYLNCKVFVDGVRDSLMDAVNDDDRLWPGYEEGKVEQMDIHVHVLVPREYEGKMYFTVSGTKLEYGEEVKDEQETVTYIF